jgi:hypothetical protein
MEVCKERVRGVWLEKKSDDIACVERLWYYRPREKYESILNA